MMPLDAVPPDQLSQVIAHATAPSFLLGAVSGFVAVLMGRMNGIIDRIRTVNAIPEDDQARAYLKADLPRLKRRAKRHLHHAPGDLGLRQRPVRRAARAGCGGDVCPGAGPDVRLTADAGARGADGAHRVRSFRVTDRDPPAATSRDID